MIKYLSAKENLIWFDEAPDWSVKLWQIGREMTEEVFILVMVVY